MMNASTRATATYSSGGISCPISTALYSVRASPTSCTIGMRSSVAFSRIFVATAPAPLAITRGAPLAGS